MLDALWLDVRYCMRSLRRSPGFSSIVVLTLMLAVGANTALFRLLNAVVLRKLPVPEPDRLVNVSLADPHSNVMRLIAALRRRPQRRRHDRWIRLRVPARGHVRRRLAGARCRVDRSARRAAARLTVG